MLLGFKPRFVDPIVRGSKTHTIRAPRKDGQRAKRGELLYMYTGLRTKNCKKIGIAECLQTSDIRITKSGVSIDGVKLASDELNDLSMRDGFESYEHFRRYWCQTQSLPFNGVITFWTGFIPS